MPVEVATYINQLDPLSPAGTDPKSQGDDHLRTIKSAVKQTFPNVAGAVNASHVELNHLVGVTSAVQPQIDLKASKTGDGYTGIHDFSLATSVKLPAATTIGAVTAAELGYLSGVTSAIQSQFSGVSTALTGKVSRSGDTYTGSHVMTGAVVTVATQPLTDKSTKAASTKHVDDAITAAALSLSLPGQAGNAGKYLSTDGTNAGWASAPVVSVMGRSGVVTGLVEDKSTSLAVGANLDGVTKAGFYRFGGAFALDGVDVTFGQMIVSSSGTGSIMQLAGHYSNGNLMWRGGDLGSGVFTPWHRVITDRTVLVNRAYRTITTAAVTVNPADGSRQVLVQQINMTITVSAPRSGGDEVVLHIFNNGPYSYAFSAGSNVQLPKGLAAVPSIASGEVMTLTLLPNFAGNGWILFPGAKH